MHTQEGFLSRASLWPTSGYKSEGIRISWLCLFMAVRVFERAVKVKFVVYLLKTMRLCKCTSLFKPILKTFARVRSCKKKCIKCYWPSWTFYHCSYESCLNCQPMTLSAKTQTAPSEWLRLFLSQLKLEKHHENRVLIFTTLQLIVMKENTAQLHTSNVFVVTVWSPNNKLVREKWAFSLLVF